MKRTIRQAGHRLLERQATLAIVAILAVAALSSLAWVMPGVREKLGMK